MLLLLHTFGIGKMCAAKRNCDEEKKRLHRHHNLPIPVSRGLMLPELVLDDALLELRTEF
jgi:hypothetical protein